MSTNIILDTNVLSEMIRVQPDENAVAWYIRQTPSSLWTTSITLAEALYGLEIMPPGKRRETLIHLFQANFEDAFLGRVLPFDDFAARAYSQLRTNRKTLGRPIGVLDAQIAAIALANGFILATRNTADFEHCGISLINPWLA